MRSWRKRSGRWYEGVELGWEMWILMFFFCLLNLLIIPLQRTKDQITLCSAPSEGWKPSNKTLLGEIKPAFMDRNDFEKRKVTTKKFFVIDEIFNATNKSLISVLNYNWQTENFWWPHWRKKIKVSILWNVQLEIRDGSLLLATFSLFGLSGF